MLKEDYGIWLEGYERAKYQRGILPSESEILIVGGGITGVTGAYLLSKEGKKVVLLEKRKLGEWVTDCTTGFLTQIIDVDLNKIIKLFGREKAALIIKSHAEAIDEIENIINIEKIDCEFRRCSHYIYANNKSEEKDLLKITDIFKSLGVKAEYKKDKALTFSDFGYIEVFNQAKFHAMKYLTALAGLAHKYGAIIAEDTEVLSVDNKGDYVLAEVKDAGTIKIKKIFSASHLPFNNPVELSAKYNMYRSYVMEYKLPKNVLISGTYQDNLLPYHYFRIDNREEYDRLVIGGFDHLNVIKTDRSLNYQAIRKYVADNFADYKYEEVRYWYGLIMNSVDQLPFMGELGNGNIFYAFGFSGNGLTYSYTAAKLFLKKIKNENSIYAEIFDVSRKISWWAGFFR